MNDWVDPSRGDADARARVTGSRLRSRRIARPEEVARRVFDADLKGGITVVKGPVEAPDAYAQFTLGGRIVQVSFLDDDLLPEFGPLLDAGAAYTWHHSEVTGQLELIERSTHQAVQHLGGSRLWGETLAKNARDGKLGPQ